MADRLNEDLSHRYSLADRASHVRYFLRMKPLNILKVMVVFLVLSSAYSVFANGSDPDENISADWVAEPRLSLDEEVTSLEAISFVSGAIEKLNQKIFDPNFKAAERKLIPQNFLKEIGSKKSITRGGVLNFLNDEFKKLKVSHLGILSPEKAASLVGSLLSREEEAGSPNGFAVTSKMYGDIGVISISSFMVPAITLQQVENAYKALDSANVLVYDLRNNGGGSSSSVVYVAGKIIGPAKTVMFTRTRSGLSKNKPFIKYGWIDDVKNSGSSGDIELERKKMFVERRTSKSENYEKRPVFLLVNEKCASSCEIFASAVQEHSAATLLGKKTAGAVMGSIGFRLLWKGFVAIFPTAQVLSPNMKLYESVGVAPDIELPFTSDNEKDLQLSLDFIRQSLAGFSKRPR